MLHCYDRALAFAIRQLKSDEARLASELARLRTRLRELRRELRGESGPSQAVGFEPAAGRTSARRVNE